jgi:hypothetical protein
MKTIIRSLLLSLILCALVANGASAEKGFKPKDVVCVFNMGSAAVGKADYLQFSAWNSLDFDTYCSGATGVTAIDVERVIYDPNGTGALMSDNQASATVRISITDDSSYQTGGTQLGILGPANFDVTLREHVRVTNGKYLQLNGSCTGTPNSLNTQLRCGSLIYLIGKTAQ